MKKKKCDNSICNMSSRAMLIVAWELNLSKKNDTKFRDNTFIIIKYLEFNKSKFSIRATEKLAKSCRTNYEKTNAHKYCY